MIGIEESHELLLQIGLMFPSQLAAIRLFQGEHL